MIICSTIFMAENRPGDGQATDGKICIAWRRENLEGLSTRTKCIHPGCLFLLYRLAIGCRNSANQ